MRGLGFGDNALTANAYLGGFGIAAALDAGADVVVTGRVTDASLVVGPAAAHHGWDATSYDALAGAVVAGHVLECGTQATGGNFSGFRALGLDAHPAGLPARRDRRRRQLRGHQARRHRRRGHRRHRDRPAGLRDPDQPLPQPRRHHPPRLDHARPRTATTGSRSPACAARRRPSGSRCASTSSAGSATRWSSCSPASTSTQKADWLRAQLEPQLTAESVTWTQTATPPADADTEEGASCLLRCTVMDPRADPVGKAFTAPAVELALGSYPGFTMTAPPGRPTPYGIYRPEYVDRSAGHPHRRPPRRPARGGRRPEGVRRVRPGGRPPPVAVPRAAGPGQPPDAARHVRARPVRRQGRRRQPGAVGRPRRLRRSTTSG